MLTSLRKTLLKREYDILSEELDEMILLGEDDDTLLEDEELENYSEETNFDDIPEDGPDAGDEDLDEMLDEATKETEDRTMEDVEKEENSISENSEEELSEETLVEEQEKGTEIMNFTEQLEYFGEFLLEAMDIQESDDKGQAPMDGGFDDEDHTDKKEIKSESTDTDLAGFLFSESDDEADTEFEYTEKDLDMDLEEGCKKEEPELEESCKKGEDCLEESESFFDLFWE